MENAIQKLDSIDKQKGTDDSRVILDHRSLEQISEPFNVIMPELLSLYGLSLTLIRRIKNTSALSFEAGTSTLCIGDNIRGAVLKFEEILVYFCKEIMAT